MAPSSVMSFVVACLLVAFAAVATPSPALPFPACVPCAPCAEPTPIYIEPPTECRTPLLNMMPCAGFLTNSSVTAPPSSCCEGFHEIARAGAAICYCRVVNGDVQQILPAPMNFTRMFSLTTECRSYFGLDALAKHCDRDGAPPMTLPSPPGKASPPPAS